MWRVACEDANSKLVEVVTVADVDAEDYVGNTILIINISNNNNIKKFWVGIFTRQGYINQVY